MCTYVVHTGSKYKYTVSWDNVVNNIVCTVGTWCLSVNVRILYGFFFFF